MSCKGCGNKEKSFNIDSRGNVRNESVLGEYEKSQHSHRVEGVNLSYKDFVELKEETRKKARLLGNQEVDKFSDDMKRIIIHDLVAVANAEEVSPLKISPTQALDVLWNFVHDKSWEGVVNEFIGLREQVDKRYEEIKSKKIKLFWKF